MRYSKGQKLLIPFILSGMIALSGCAQEEASGGVTDVAGALFLSENETGAAAVTEDQTAVSTQGFANTDLEVTEIPEAPDTVTEAERARKLSEEECMKLEDFLNEEGSYGFLLSTYEKPQDIDVEQVFYIGAGLAELGVSEEEREAYLEETEEEEAPNLFRLSAQQISDHLQYRAGIAIEDLTETPDWVYLEEYDAYYQSHSDEDTNICRFEVTDAAVQGDYYRVHYSFRRERTLTDGWYDPVYETILKRNGDGYRFCANRLWMEKDLLLRPFCSVEIDPYGEVYLCAYEPDENVENADVTFALVKQGEVITLLPGVSGQNIRTNQTFEDVVSVDTGDYDGDGRKEILAIVSYKTARAPRQGDDKDGAKADESAQLREDGEEARIYRFSEDGKLQYDSALSSRINKDIRSLSITGISQYIKTGKDRGPFENRKEAYTAEIEAVEKEAYDRFALIYINEDREPELLEMGSTPDKGAKIIFFNGGELEETKVSSTFSYLKKENRLYSKSGTENVFNEALYLYGGGTFDIYLSGTYGALDAAHTAYSEDGKPQYLYTWEGSYVSEAGYQDALGFVYNRQKAVDASAIETLSAEQMLEELKKQ